MAQMHVIKMVAVKSESDEKKTDYRRVQGVLSLLLDDFQAD
jgi:hypothetical protein